MSSAQSNLNPNLNRSYASQPISNVTAPLSMHLPSTLPNMSMSMALHQQPQYPAINSIPGMQSINSMGAFHNLHGLQPMSSMHSFQTMPTIPAMQSLIHPSPDTTAHALSTNPVSSAFGASLLSGAIDKRRKPRKSRTSAYSGLLSNDDAATMMMAHAATQVATHPDPVSGLPATSPQPVYECDGIQFKVLEQLPDTKIQRLRTEKIKPIELLTFEDIKAYNRNQLRAYCSVYGIRRKKKADMERDMARYASLFHPGNPDYDWHKFEPTEYADGPIPRRKVPVTKEQKEKAAGDFKKLTNALQQRPHVSSLTSHHYPTLGGGGSSSHHTLGTSHHALSSSHHALSSSHHTPYHPGLSASRLPDIHGTQHNTIHGHHHHHAHLTSHHTHVDDHGDGVGVSASELMSVPEMHVPNHLLSISHQIPEE